MAANIRKNDGFIFSKLLTEGAKLVLKEPVQLKKS